MATLDGKIAIIGLGYVGLPLAVAFGEKRPVIGFDIRQERIEELRAGKDLTLETTDEELAAATQLEYTSDPDDLRECQTFIITVPTPVDHANRPDLSPVRRASEMVGKIIGANSVVIYESTVFPGCTQNVCVPILEEQSGLKHNQDFHTGYSPERINPGDRSHRLQTIVKVTSGSTPQVAEKIDSLYGEIIHAGTYKAPSIEVAEAAKVIENTQRDLNIALMNELSIIFDRLSIDTIEVLKTAGTKWNFLPFRPGLVGGHCIGVDPYYLTYRAEEVGYHPQVILAGRRINDGMGRSVAERVMKLMMKRGFPVVDSRILVLGLAFKENCPDLRNSRVIDVIETLADYNANVDVHDPWASAEQSNREYGVDLVEEPEKGAYDAVILAVGHREYIEAGAQRLRSYGKQDAVFYDVKSVFERDESDGRL
ncbi:nucleotide sugar dehydrogenase [Notoacmeibacter ruber]|uniref:Nucleotide sugar dehydrogenase n=1 Tax=Notoacmeibacter ruber TaxID=2670375 RepID=A0A3L7JC02_9HYPH|nr:nucleotide sugar dehydrogenase [Notoacmeibacter ruber]RLQ88278.1 nucleotide sugar dehydrogenase [Notoacmeibacter ruber]